MCMSSSSGYLNVCEAYQGKRASDNETDLRLFLGISVSYYVKVDDRYSHHQLVKCLARDDCMFQDIEILPVLKAMMVHRQVNHRV